MPDKVRSMLQDKNNFKIGKGRNSEWKKSDWDSVSNA